MTIEVPRNGGVTRKQVAGAMVALANVMGQAISKNVPKGWKFVLLFAEDRDGTDLAWSSDMKRSDVLKAARRLAEWIEADAAKKAAEEQKPKEGADGA